jgi:CRISPR-associated endonuclease/helicase Cas3
MHANCESRVSSLPEKVRQTVTYAAAMHDIGKADPRYQAWLRGGNPIKADQLIAKSAKSGYSREVLERARRQAGYAKGARHELLSLALVSGAKTCREEKIDPDLLLYLIGSHHGRCRPFAPVVADMEPIRVDYEIWFYSRICG